MGKRRREFSIDEYAHQRGEDLNRCGGYVENFTVVDTGLGRIAVQGSVSFGAELQARLSVFEAIEVVDGRPHRLKYAYQITYRGEFVVRYDRDPVSHPRMPEHQHVGRDRRRVRCPRRTLAEVIEETYDLVRRREAEEALSPAHSL